MISQVTSLLANLDRERKSLNQVTGSQLHSKKIRTSLREIVEQYFNEIRPLLLENSLEKENFITVDGKMQELNTLCHKHGSATKYKDLLRSIKKDLISIDTQLVSFSPRNDSEFQTDVDARIIITLRALLPSAALSYEQALLDIEQPTRLSWRGPATDLREALREALDHLAPDADVTASTGYKQISETNGPTMKQKVRYIMRNRGISKAHSAPAEDASELIDEAIGSFVRSVYTRSSVSTHTPTDKDEVLQVLSFVRVVLCELLEVR